jgi:hypothetical protein
LPLTLPPGAKETADLIEESLAGRPARPTRGFEEREAPFRALDHDQLLNRVVSENMRKMAAWEALAERTDNPAIAFTGTTVSVDELRTHTRSEAAIHRWDLVGDDDIATETLGQPELTAHAVKILNRMPILNESARALAGRAAETATVSLRIVFRSAGRADVVLDASPEGGHFEISDEPVDGDVTVVTDPANRLLALWGRKSAERRIDLDGDPSLISAMDRVLRPDARPWPRASAVTA